MAVDYFLKIYIKMSMLIDEFEQIKPTAWKAGKVIHEFPDLAGGYEPLYKKSDILKLLEKFK